MLYYYNLISGKDKIFIKRCRFDRDPQFSLIPRIIHMTQEERHIQDGRQLDIRDISLIKTMYITIHGTEAASSTPGSQRKQKRKPVTNGGPTMEHSKRCIT